MTRNGGMEPGYDSRSIEINIRRAMEEQAKIASDCKRVAEDVLARADGRDLTPGEQERWDAHDLKRTRATAAVMLLKRLEALRQKAEHGPLDLWDIKLLKVLVKSQLPGAQAILQGCRRVRQGGAR